MGKDISFSGDEYKMNFDIEQVREVDCIVVDKVYAQYQDRECITQLEIGIKKGSFSGIRFAPGYIVPDTLIVNDIPNKPHFRRVRFDLRIPYEIFFKDGTSRQENLPDISKDIVMFIPDARDEFEFNIVPETSSNILGQPIIDDNNVNFSVGIFMILKVVGQVQLMIPTFGFCPEPPPVIDFTQKGDCDNFENHLFPVFFPLQYGDIQANKKKDE